MREFIYNLKLSLIVILCILFLALIETAPDRPLLFLCLSAFYIFSIRFLWKSSERDKLQIKRGIFPFKNKPSENPNKNKRAA